MGCLLKGIPTIKRNIMGKIVKNAINTKLLEYAGHRVGEPIKDHLKTLRTVQLLNMDYGDHLRGKSPLLIHERKVKWNDEFFKR